MADEVLVETTVDGVLLVTLNRPAKLNAIDLATAELLVEAMTRLDEDPDLRVGVLAGNGRAFSAGMDLRAFGQAGAPRALGRFVRFGSRKPLVAAVDGLAFGGGLELALTCDLVIASRRAAFAIPEVKVGVIAGAGGLLRLPRRLDPGRATLMALTGEPISADEAYAGGLVTSVVDDGTAVDKALAIAQSIARNAPKAVAASKQLLRSQAGLTESEYWKLQQPLLDEVMRSEDAVEGPRAFVEKRAPVWRNG